MSTCVISICHNSLVYNPGGLAPDTFFLIFKAHRCYMYQLFFWSASMEYDNQHVDDGHLCAIWHVFLQGNKYWHGQVISSFILLPFALSRPEWAPVWEIYIRLEHFCRKRCLLFWTLMTQAQYWAPRMFEERYWVILSAESVISHEQTV